MAWTTPRTWTDGELVTAAMMNAHVRDNLNAVGGHALAYKASDESVNSAGTGTTLQNDNDLLFAMATSEVWFVQMILYGVDVSGAANFKIAATIPASAVMHLTSTIVQASGTTTEVHIETSGAAASGGWIGRANGNVSVWSGIVTTAGTAGNFQFQWAQNTANASNTTIKAGSHLLGRKLA